MACITKNAFKGVISEALDGVVVCIIEILKALCLALLMAYSFIINYSSNTFSGELNPHIQTSPRDVFVNKLSYSYNHFIYFSEQIFSL